MATFRLELVTAERMVYSDDVDMVIAWGLEGQLGILPHHAPLMTMLQPGELIICLLYTSPSPRDVEESRMPSSA